MLPPFYTDNIDFNPGDESVFKDASIAEVFNFGADEGSSFAGLNVLKLYNRPEVIIEFDAQSIPEISGCSHNKGILE
jgi:hypothetical protein